MKKVAMILVGVLFVFTGICFAQNQLNQGQQMGQSQGQSLYNAPTTISNAGANASAGSNSVSGANSTSNSGANIGNVSSAVGNVGASVGNVGSQSGASVGDVGSQSAASVGTVSPTSTSSVTLNQTSVSNIPRPFAETVQPFFGPVQPYFGPMKEGFNFGFPRGKSKWNIMEARRLVKRDVRSESRAVELTEPTKELMVVGEIPDESKIIVLGYVAVIADEKKATSLDVIGKAMVEAMDMGGKYLYVFSHNAELWTKGSGIGVGSTVSGSGITTGQSVSGSASMGIGYSSTTSKVLSVPFVQGTVYKLR